MTRIKWTLSRCMIIPVLILLLFTSAIASFAQAEKGVIHYDGEVTLSLKGEWKFFWKKLYSEDTTLLQSSGEMFVFCPDTWNHLEIDGEKLPSFGYATYALQIVCKKDHPDVALEIPKFYTAYTLYLDGEIIAKNGTVGKTSETSSFLWMPVTKSINLKKGTNQLVLEISNFQHSKGGFSSGIILGSHDHLKTNKERGMILVTFMIGSLTAIGIFLMGMHLYWKNDIAVLFYSLFCLSFSLRLGNSGLYLFSKLLDFIPGPAIAKTEYLSLYLNCLFLALFFRSVIVRDSDQIIINLTKAVTYITLVFIFSTLILPLSIYPRLVPFYIYITLPALVYALFRALYKHKGEFFVKLGILLIGCGFIWAGIMSVGWIPKPPYLNNFMLYLILSFSLLMMTYLLAQRFGRSFRTIEMLQQETLQQKKYIEEQKATQSRWFTNVAHELRTPLTLILGPVKQFLSRHKDHGDKDLESIRLVEKNSTHLLEMVNEILDVSNLESNLLKLKKEATPLAPLIREAVTHFEAAAAMKGVALQTRFSRHLVLDADKKRIRNILFNLLSNALKFTHKGGMVEISVHHEPHQDVEVQVSDTGDGIPEADLPHVFERYYQATVAGQVNAGGLGIGLALSRELARLHRGDLACESRKGEGSTFTLTLPGSSIVSNPQYLNETPEVPQGVQAGPSPGEPPPVQVDKDAPSVLLVEDHHDMRQYIRSLLSSAYRITEAIDGAEAWEQITAHTPDLVISDIMMPRMDGFQLLDKLRATSTTVHIPVIILTARAGREDRMHALTTGVDDYLAKPFDEEELMARIRYILKSQQQRKQWSAQLPEEDKELLTADRQFLKKAEEAVFSAISEPDYGVFEMAATLHISQRQLFRKIKTATGLSPLQFIREIRLQQARTLLESKATETVAEVMYAVGFRQSNYFARVYRKRFGKLPSDYYAS